MLLKSFVSPAQLVILSGKGGTGKTSLSAAFARLSLDNATSPRAVFVDADVDAANLSLVLRPDVLETHEFWGGAVAEIDPGQCSGCGGCASVCRFDAVREIPIASGEYQIDPIACEGCAACVYACSQGAVRMVPQQDGLWFRSMTPYGALFHAELFPGKDNSGKLVTLVKQQARSWAEEESFPMVVIDGPPGIGCPVISACAGADLGLIVAEPGEAGLHDLKRVLRTLQHFRIPSVICINKADLYPFGARQIRDFAAGEGVEVLGEIPFDESVPKAMVGGGPITQIFPESPAARSINQIWGMLLRKLIAEKALES